MFRLHLRTGAPEPPLAECSPCRPKMLQSGRGEGQKRGQRERERERGGEEEKEMQRIISPLGSLWPQQKWNVIQAVRMSSASWLRLAKTDASTCHEESQSTSFEHSSHPPASFDRQEMLQRWLPLESAKILPSSLAARQPMRPTIPM